MFESAEQSAIMKVMSLIFGMTERNSGAGSMKNKTVGDETGHEYHFTLYEE